LLLPLPATTGPSITSTSGPTTTGTIQSETPLASACAPTVIATTASGTTTSPSSLPSTSATQRLSSPARHPVRRFRPSVWPRPPVRRGERDTRPPILPFPEGLVTPPSLKPGAKTGLRLQGDQRNWLPLRKRRQNSLWRSPEGRFRYILHDL
jgi:hypothetical protein